MYEENSLLVPQGLMLIILHYRRLPTGVTVQYCCYVRSERFFFDEESGKHSVYTLQPVVQPVVWTMQMSPAKSAWAGQSGRYWRHCVDARSKAACRRFGAFDRNLKKNKFFLPGIYFFTFGSMIQRDDKNWMNPLYNPKAGTPLAYVDLLRTCCGLLVDLLMSVTFRTFRYYGFVVGVGFVVPQVARQIHNRSK